MNIKEYSSKKELEAKVREQNLIHELVVINQLLVEAADKLQNEANKVPQLQEQIQQLLQIELKQAQKKVPETPTISASPLAEVQVDLSRIERARFEAEQQKLDDNFSTTMKERHISLSSQQEHSDALNKIPEEVIQLIIKTKPSIE